jgi:hypothetical protein
MFMSLLKWLQSVSPFRGMPSDNKKNSSVPVNISGETIQLFYYSSGTLTIDAGQAAGTVVVGRLLFDNIKIPEGTLEATGTNNSLSFTSTALTTQVGLSKVKPEFVEALDESTGSVRAAAIGALLSNGEWYLDAATGTIIGKKASTQTALTSASFKIRQLATTLANKLSFASITKTTTASQDIVAAPATGSRLRIYGYTITNGGTEQVTATITGVTVVSTKDGGGNNMHLPGYIDLAAATACTATLNTTSTAGIVIGVWYQVMTN